MDIGDIALTAAITAISSNIITTIVLVKILKVKVEGLEKAQDRLRTSLSELRTKIDNLVLSLL